MLRGVLYSDNEEERVLRVERLIEELQRRKVARKPDPEQSAADQPVNDKPATKTATHRRTLVLIVPRK
jgi:hypothetical protein